jgi:hypothetical protein
VKIKTGFNLVVMLALLAFGPRENRDFFFRTSPDQLYGETEVFRDNAGTFSVARNASSESVELLDTAPMCVRSTDLRDGSFYTSKDDKLVYAESVAIIERGNGVNNTTPNVRIGKSQPRKPRSLRIVTEAEELYELLWPGIIVLLVVILTYLINDFSWECGSPIQDIVKLTEVSS